MKAFLLFKNSDFNPERTLAPAHQYSFTTIRLQPRFPGFVMVKTSSVTPYLGLVKLWRSRSHSTVDRPLR